VEKVSTRLRLSTSERRGRQSDVQKGQHEFCGSRNISRTGRVSHQSAAAFCGHKANKGDYYSAVGQVASEPRLTLISSELASSLQLTATRGCRSLSLCSTAPPRIPQPLAHSRARPALSVADPTFFGCTLFSFGRSRLGARHHRGGWLFPCLCAPPRSRLAVPVSVRATTVVVGCSLLGARRHGRAWLFPSWCAPPRSWLAVPVSVRATTVVVGCSRLGARHHGRGWLFPSRCAPPLPWLAVPASVRAASDAVASSRVRARRRACDLINSVAPRCVLAFYIDSSG